MSARRVWLLLAFAGACSRHGDVASQPEPVASSSGSVRHSDEAAHGELPTRVRLLPSVIADAKIQTSLVTREPLAVTLDLPGEIASDPDTTAKVSALVPGRIEAVRFREGQSVKQGDVLLVIRVPELGKAKAAFAATAAKAAAARSNAERLQALASKQLAATQEVVAASAEADALGAEARAAEEQLKALGTPTSGAVGSQLALRAPVSGVVITRDAVVGQPVAAEQVLATLADLSEVWFLARVFEKNLAQVRVGAPAEVELNAYPKQRFTGAVEYISKQIDPSARTLVARVRLSNRDELLRLGLFGVARVGSGQATERPAVLVVARSAVTELGQKHVVFVQQSDGDFDLHEVVLGDSALGKVEIVNGLREGERVVTAGVFTLKSALLKGSFGEEE